MQVASLPPIMLLYLTTTYQNADAEKSKNDHAGVDILLPGTWYTSQTIRIDIVTPWGPKIQRARDIPTFDLEPKPW